jgi:hypothetical protein
VQAYAWVDADIEFLSSSWVDDTLHAVRQLESKGGGFVQMFEQAELLGPNDRPMYSPLLLSIKLFFRINWMAPTGTASTALPSSIVSEWTMQTE